MVTRVLEFVKHGDGVILQRDVDHVLYDEKGKSHISLQDYAVAMLDELEHPRHHRERFTVGY